MIPRTLLITNFAPGRVGVGRLFLRDLCLLYPHDRICCFHTDHYLESQGGCDLEWLPMHFESFVLSHGYYRFGRRFAQITRPIIERYIDTVLIPNITRKVVYFAKLHNIELIWAVMDSTITIRLTKSVKDILNLPLVTTVWDPPDITIRPYKLDHRSEDRMLSSFENNIRSSSRCSVASYEMKHRYEKLYGIDCVVMTYGLCREKQAIHENNQPNNEMLVIGFAGSIYAKQEWNALINALNSKNWQIAGKKVVIRVLSSEIHYNTNESLNIEFFGWRRTEEALHLLSQMDIAYLPYWFDKYYREVVQLAFPSKLSTYIAARTPVFFHGPRISSVSQFMEQFPVGIGCNSLDKDDIIRSLERFVIDNTFYQNAKLACDRAFYNELSAEVFHERFARFIDIQDNRKKVDESARI